MKNIYLLLFITLGISSSTFAQDSTSSNLLSVYLDCRSCNGSFIRSEINFVNFVRDQADARLHLLVTSQGTGSGGREYSLEFIGQDDLEDLSRTIIFNTFDTDTEDEVRNELLRQIKFGFFPFLTRLNMLSKFDISYNGNGESQNLAQSSDRWNSWVFELGGSSWFSGEESESSLSLNGRVRAQRTTEDVKIRLSYDYNLNRDVYNLDSTFTDPITFEESQVDYDETYQTIRHNAFGLIAFSMGDHWSVGSYFSAGSSSRDNIDFRVGISPAIEYSFYPYRDYARREVTLRYGLATDFYDYHERTIYSKDEETLVNQELDFRMDYTKPWGGIEARITASAFLHDFSKNRLGTGFEIDMRVVRGINIFFDVNYSWINDQLSISADGVTDKEAIADTRQQLTSYEFWGRVGIEITFGSIYDNVVNTRF